jgi:amidase
MNEVGDSHASVAGSSVVQDEGDGGSMAFAGATELARLIRERTVSPVEVIEQTLGRIERLNGHLHAYLTVCSEQARRAAVQAERDLAAGRDVGPLHGVPFSVKDMEMTAETRTTFGSLLFASNVPDQDSIAVERLRAAGAILVGKTNTPEFGLLGETRNLLGDDARNPWDLNRTTGGSSGGAAAAVAAGMGPLAVGNDGAGSIAAPSAMCGSVGVKPSTGRVPAWPIPQGPRLFAATGPIARSVEDAQLMLSIMSGHDPRDPISRRDCIRGGPTANNKSPMRVAWTADLGHFPVDPEVSELGEGAARALEEIGWPVTEACPSIPNPWNSYLPLFRAEVWLELEPLVERGRDELDPAALSEILPGRDVTVGAYIRALGELTHVQRGIDDFFLHHDVLVLPATATTAFPVREPPTMIGNEIVEASWMDYMPFPVAWNMGGNPTITVPIGTTAGGMPVGVMLVARVGREDLVLRAAQAVELARPWEDRRPSLPVVPGKDGARWE